MTDDDPTTTAPIDAAQGPARDLQPARDLAFRFTGNGWEYFKIWIVNLLLTILTLGIYSAWATVRTTQYFYGNTLLDEASFRFTARPLAILIGRIIAVAAFVVFTLAQEFAPPLALILIVVLLLAIPAIVVRAMAFRLRHSQYRNVAFRFQRNYRQAYAVLMGPMLVFVALILAFGFAAKAAGGEDQSIGAGIGIAVLAFLLAVPFVNYLVTAFYVNNSHYGESAFAYTGRAGGFYKLYGMTLLVGIGAMIPVFLLLSAIGGGTAMLIDSAQAGDGAELGRTLPTLLSQGIGLLILVPAYLLIYAYFQARRFNLIYNNSVLAEQHGFSARLGTGGLAWLYLSNLLLILFTLGLGTAWAKVRTARYHLDRLAFLAAGDLDHFTAAEEEKAGALGDELGEVFDLEVGL